MAIPDSLKWAASALERCIEAEKARLDAEAAVDAELEALFGEPLTFEPEYQAGDLVG
jgi:hypothetical protein